MLARVLKSLIAATSISAIVFVIATRLVMMRVGDQGDASYAVVIYGWSAALLVFPVAFLVFMARLSRSGNNGGDKSAQPTDRTDAAGDSEGREE